MAAHRSDRRQALEDHQHRARAGPRRQMRGRPPRGLRALDLLADRVHHRPRLLPARLVKANVALFGGEVADADDPPIALPQVGIAFDQSRSGLVTPGDPPAAGESPPPVWRMFALPPPL